MEKHRTIRLPQRRDILSGNKSSYVVRKLIDQGGVGAVFLAVRQSDGASVAVKLLHGGRFPVSDVSLKRFAEEIDLSLGLDHRNIVRSTDTGKHAGALFLVMEYLNGGTIAQRVERKDYDYPTAFRWCAELVDGLEHLHSKGCVHRDIKPNNLLISSEGALKISDLGILKDMSKEAYLTLSGEQMGSVLYISRRQRQQPELADASDDAYAACCCFYEILAKQRLHLYPAHLGAITAGAIPEYLCDLIMGALAGRAPREAMRAVRSSLICTDGHWGLLPESTSPRLNTMVQITRPSDSNQGLLRKRFAQTAPLNCLGVFLQKYGELGAPRMTFIGASRLVVADCVRERRSLDIVAVSTQGVQIVTSLPIGHWVDELVAISASQFVAAGGGIVSVVRVHPEGAEIVRSSEPLRCKKDSGPTTLSAHRTHPVAAFTKAGSYLALLNFLTGELAEIAEVTVDDDAYEVQVDFCALDRLLHHDNRGMRILKVDPHKLVAKGDAKMVSTESAGYCTRCSPDGLVAYVGGVHGLVAVSLSDGRKLWKWPDWETPVWRMKVSDSTGYIAVCYGMGIADSLAILSGDGIVMANIPAAAREHWGFQERAQEVAWSPDGALLAAMVNKQGLTIFSS